MIKINKDFSTKLIAILIAVVFFVNNAAYGMVLSNKSCLRVPSGVQKDRWQGLIDAVGQILASKRDVEKQMEQILKDAPAEGKLQEKRLLQDLRNTKGVSYAEIFYPTEPIYLNEEKEENRKLHKFYNFSRKKSERQSYHLMHLIQNMAHAKMPVLLVICKEEGYMKAIAWDYGRGFVGTIRESFKRGTTSRRGRRIDREDEEFLYSPRYNFSFDGMGLYAVASTFVAELDGQIICETKNSKRDTKVIITRSKAGKMEYSKTVKSSLSHGGTKITIIVPESAGNFGSKIPMSCL